MGEPLVLVGVEPEVAWMHRDCRDGWLNRRQADARRAFQEMGFLSPQAMSSPAAC
jgi:hypothetical protein